MRTFFIDLENVRSYGLEGVLLLKPDDMVYIFYSENANALTIPTIESLNESAATIKYIRTNYIGANAMDFQIVTMLGAMIEREKQGGFYIITHDNGFKSAVKFCEGYFTGYNITTGIYANILLAINSENQGKKGSRSVSARSGKGKDMQPEHAEAETAAEPDEMIYEADGANEDVAEAPADEAVAEVQAEKEEITETKSRRSGRNRRRGNRNKRHEENADAGMTSGETEPAAEKTATDEPKSDKGRTSRRNRRNSGKNKNAGENLSEVKTEAVQETKTEPVTVTAETEAETVAKAENRAEAENGAKAENRAKAETVAKAETGAEAENRAEAEIKAETEIKAENETGAEAEKENKTAAGSKAKSKSKSKSKTAAKEKTKSEVPAEKEEKAESDAGTKTKSAKKSKSGKTAKTENKYVYEALSGILSKSAIDMYAKKIDEGIRQSATPEDLHEFFKKNYGSDEAEALHKIIASDFEKMKKNAK